MVFGTSRACRTGHPPARASTASPGRRTSHASLIVRGGDTTVGRDETGSRDSPADVPVIPSRFPRQHVGRSTVFRLETRARAMQTAARPAMARDQENVAPAAKVKQHAEPEVEKNKKYVGIFSSSSGRSARVPQETSPIVGPPFAVASLTVATPSPRPSRPDRDRPKEVKCPRVVTETYKDARTGETRTRSYVRGRPLGKGGFAVVYSVQDPSTGESFAAKVVAKSALEKDRARRKILTEIRIHRGVDNPHVVKFKKCFEDAENVYILMELCSDKTLADVVKRRGRLTESECAPYAREMVSAVAHLHRDCGVIHRDLKLGNVFLTPAGLDEALTPGEGGPGSDADLGANPSSGTRLKIGDFGLACAVERDGDKKRTICGTPNYIAPEVLAGSKGGGHSFEVDVWSLGVILYALLVGTPPFQTSDVKATYKRIRANAYEFPKKDDGSGEHLLSRRAMDLIKRCLAPKPADRPSLEAIANHPLCRVGAPEWRLPPATKTKNCAALLAAKDEKPTPAPAPASRAPLSPLPANFPARAAGILKATRSAKRSETQLESRDGVSLAGARTDPSSSSTRAKPRRAAEEGAPKPKAASPSVPSAPPASARAEAAPVSGAVAVRAAPSEALLRAPGGESSSSLADDDDDVGARVADAMTAGGGDSAASTSALAPASIAAFPPVWVVKWVDYTSKYGLGYRLSDGTFGVVFNDATKMSQEGAPETPGEGPGTSPGTRDDAGDRLEYRERARRGSGSNQGRRGGGDGAPSGSPSPCVAFSASAAPPAGLEKKTKLMRHFRGYLAKDGRSAVERTAGGLFDGFERASNAREWTRDGGGDVLPRAAEETRAAAAAAARSTASTSAAPYLPHVKNWLRTKHAILFRLSNRTIQVNFTDGSEILLSSEAQACVFACPRTGKRAAHLLAKLPADPELLRRLRYVKEVLHQLVHRA